MTVNDLKEIVDEMIRNDKGHLKVTIQVDGGKKVLTAEVDMALEVNQTNVILADETEGSVKGSKHSGVSFEFEKLIPQLLLFTGG